jgi:hypothetical protein
MVQEKGTELKGTGLSCVFLCSVNVTDTLSVVAVVLYYTAPCVNLYVPCRVLAHLKRTEIIYATVSVNTKVRFS